jgi:hypothetical protein
VKTQKNRSNVEELVSSLAEKASNDCENMTTYVLGLCHVSSISATYSSGYSFIIEEHVKNTYII